MRILEEISELSTEILAIVKPDFSIEFQGKRWKELVPSTNSLASIAHRDLIHGDDQAEFELYVKLALAGHPVAPFENRIRIAEFSRWVMWHVAKSQHGDYVVAVGKEITDEKSCDPT